MGLADVVVDGIRHGGVRVGEPEGCAIGKEVGLTVDIALEDSVGPRTWGVACRRSSRCSGSGLKMP